MGDVMSLDAARKARRKNSTNKRSSLCREGHHKWEMRSDTRFDVKQGRLVTVYRCKHCGKEKIKGQ